MTDALIARAPVALLVNVLEAAAARLVGAAGTNTAEGAEKFNTVPSAAAAPLTVALARTPTGAPVVKTLALAVGAGIWTDTTDAAGSPESPPPQEARSTVRGRAHRRKRVWEWCMAFDGVVSWAGLCPAIQRE